MSLETMTAGAGNRILAFWGYENARIAAIGQVYVQLDCIKGVTTVTTVEESVPIDSSEEERKYEEENFYSSNEEIEESTVLSVDSEGNDDQVAYILGGSGALAVLGGWVGLLILGGCGGFILSVAIIVIAVCYKQKKACFRKASDVNVTQTMPIENFKGYQGYEEENEKKGLSFKGRMPSMKRAASVK